ncbi:hypothetical protein PTSG_04287 [Salpingoeca rosetta]|uniref:Uncharacterized protein n=1 Tax=Salpingoeca rosetta (strain ATCC 50818 / BSB-021) TaxID=946362 RepID=F2U750_SALR5|nr:uncharacterized protein PTSG_04287 [Salpingoeca rosetta]EGD83682.1 hypothetical protein PTSG_04287 [Salpingoeca rosetta]|eukprot:XP_004995186.1 hypothetical protein PTSG_04287 [Salpingoeca rosetta]
MDLHDPCFPNTLASHTRSLVEHARFPCTLACRTRSPVSVVLICTWTFWQPVKKKKGGKKKKKKGLKKSNKVAPAEATFVTDEDVWESHNVQDFLHRKGFFWPFGGKKKKGGGKKKKKKGGKKKKK